MKNGPDFLCIGMQRAATRTLYGFLSLDERFWMPVVKEFHHFDEPSRPREERHRRVLGQLPIMERGAVARTALNLVRRATGRRGLSESDRVFMRKYLEYLQNGCTDADYLDLFSACPPGRLTGDITPGYSFLDRSAIERVHRLLPDAQIILVIRDPVARAWSHANLILRAEFGRRGRAGGRSPSQDMERAANSDDYLETLMRRPSVVGKGSPTRIYRNWAAIYGERIEVLTFEEVCTAQGAVADRIAALMGVPAVPGGEGRTVRNRKAQLAKVPMGERERELLVRHFRDELFECRDLFGEEKTRGWLEKYGLV